MLSHAEGRQPFQSIRVCAYPAKNAPIQTLKKLFVDCDVYVKFSGLGIGSFALRSFDLVGLCLKSNGSESLLSLFTSRTTRAKWVDRSFHFFEPRAIRSVWKSDMLFKKSDLLFYKEQMSDSLWFGKKRAKKERVPTLNVITLHVKWTKKISTNKLTDSAVNRLVLFFFNKCEIKSWNNTNWYFIRMWFKKTNRALVINPLKLGGLTNINVRDSKIGWTL